MSACPLGDVTESKISETGTFTTAAASPQDESCNAVNQNTTTSGGSSSSVSETVPGPAGPQGDPGDTGDQGYGFHYLGDWATSTAYVAQDDPDSSSRISDVVINNGVGYVCTAAHTSSASSEPGVGGSWTSYWDLFSTSSGGMHWGSLWNSGIGYTTNEVVLNYSEGGVFICISDHTSSSTNEPGVGISWTGYWERIVYGSSESEKGWLDRAIDHIKDIEDWSLEDWGNAIAFAGLAAAGLVIAGTVIENMITVDGAYDGNADSTYNGSAGYNGSYTAPLLSDVLAALCDAAGDITYDVSDISAWSEEPTVEMVIGNVTSVREILEQMAIAYMFEMVDSGGILKFTPRSKESVATITDDEIGYGSTEKFVGNRIQGPDLPRTVNVQYMAADNDYNAFIQSSTLETYTDGNVVNIHLPLILTDQQAKNVADNLLINAHLERQSWLLPVSQDYAYLEAGDIITTSLGDVRINRIVEQEEGILQLTVSDAGLSAMPTPIYSGPTIIGYKASSFTGVGNDPTPSPVSNNTVPVIGYSEGLFLDLPPLDTNDSTPRLHVAFHGYGRTGWPGAALYHSLDGGTTYEFVTTSTKEATWGMVTSAISSPPNDNWHIWDDNTTITVAIKSGTLSSASDLAVMNGANRFILGREVIHFGTATYTGLDAYDNKVYELTHLLRGRQGTDYWIDQHEAKELFVLLDEAVKRVPIPESFLNTPRYYKVVTKSSDISKVSGEQRSVKGVNFAPWEVDQITVTSVGDDDTITWQQRDKWVNELMDYMEHPTDSDFAGWTVQILDVSTEEIIRSEHTMSPSYVYTEAKKIEDFGSVPGCYKYRVAAISSIYGVGYSRIYSC